MSSVIPSGHVRAKVVIALVLGAALVAILVAGQVQMPAPGGSDLRSPESALVALKYGLKGLLLVTLLRVVAGFERPSPRAFTGAEQS